MTIAGEVFQRQNFKLWNKSTGVPKKEVNIRNQRASGPKQSKRKKPENSMPDQSMRTGFGHENQDKRPDIETFHLKTFDWTLTMRHVVIIMVSVDNTMVNWFTKVMVRRRPDKRLRILNTRQWTEGIL